MMYYRTMYFRKPACSPEDLGRVPGSRQGRARQGHERRRTPDFGSCIAKKRNAQSYWFVTDVVGSMVQSKGTSQGAFFNTTT
jgi:hypothetical protein